MSLRMEFEGTRRAQARVLARLTAGYSRPLTARLARFMSLSKFLALFLPILHEQRKFNTAPKSIFDSRVGYGLHSSGLMTTETVCASGEERQRILGAVCF